MIAEVAMRDQRPGRVLLRSSKSLAQMGWFGENYQIRYQSSEELLEFLESIPVELVLLDLDQKSLTEHGRLLRQTIEANLAVWRKVASYPRDRRPDDARRHVVVYRLIDSTARPRGKIRVDLRNRVGKTLEID